MAPWANHTPQKGAMNSLGDIRIRSNSVSGGGYTIISGSRRKLVSKKIEEVALLSHAPSFMAQYVAGNIRENVVDITATSDTGNTDRASRISNLPKTEPTHNINIETRMAAKKRQVIRMGQRIVNSLLTGHPLVTTSNNTSLDQRATLRHEIQSRRSRKPFASLGSILRKF